MKSIYIYILRINMHGFESKHLIWLIINLEILSRIIKL
jgi:hypothetical protein